MDYDFLVLGGGSAGYAGARTAAALGLKTAVVEGGSEIGGLCILRGCMPSKTLLESAKRFRTIQRAAEFGLACDNPRFDTRAIVERKRRLIQEFADYRRSQLEDGRFDFIRGHAEFISKNEILVDGSRRLSARAGRRAAARGRGRRGIGWSGPRPQVSRRPPAGHAPLSPNDVPWGGPPRPRRGPRLDAAHRRGRRTSSSSS